MPKDIVGHVYKLLLCIGFVTTAAMFAVLFQLSARIDVDAADSARAKHQLILQEWQSSVSNAVKDYAHWTLAFEVVAARDADAVYEHLGSGATESDLFDWLFFLEADGSLIYAFGPPDIDTPETYFDATSIPDFLTALRAHDPLDYASVDGITPWQDGHAVISATWVTPDDFADRPGAIAPIMLGMRDLGPDALARLARNSGATRLEITQAAPERETAALALAGISSAPVGWLSWQPERPGTALRNEALPWLIVICLSVLITALSVARYFRRMAQRLRQAITTASTDQLTGLLNRAGVNEALQQPEVKTAFERGNVAVLNIDLNKFKELNDTHGHKAGDMALKVTAERLQEAARKSDVAARMGGDEFVCLIVDPDPDWAATAVADAFADLCAAPIQFVGFSSVLRPAIGVAVGTTGVQWDALLEWSDAAMYWAKKRGSFEPAYFSRSMHEADGLSDINRAVIGRA